MAKRQLTALLPAFLAFAMAAPLWAAIESESVVMGVRAYDDLEYQKAIDLLRKALGESLTREERIVAYRTLGFAEVSIDRLPEARADFAQLLRLDGKYELERTISPRIRAVFEEARTEVATTSPVVDSSLPSLALQARPSPAKEGQSIVVVAPTAASAVAIAEVQLFYRPRGSAAFSRVSAKSGATEGRIELTIPGLSVKSPGIEYYVAALDAQGTAVARGGSLTEPLGIEVVVMKRPIYKRGWFWGVLGSVAVAGAVVGAVVGTLVHPVGPTTPATVTITPQ